MSDLPPELLAAFNAALTKGATAEDEDDPPVASSGYWDYDESTAKKYWVNYQGKKPLSKATTEFYSLDRDDLKRFQELAFQAGYYGSNAEREDIPFGAYDEDTFKVWAQLNKRAAQFYAQGKNHTVWDVLQDDVSNRPQNIGKKEAKKRVPLITQLPDPREIEEMVRGIAPKVIGRDPSQDQINEFATMYRALVQNFQEEVYSLQDTEKGGTVTAPPDAASLAAFQLRTQNPEQYEEKRSAARQAAYTSLLKGAL